MKKKHLTVSLLACAVVALPLIGAVAVGAEGAPRPNQFWWPEQLDLSPLRQHAAESNPYGENFDYPKAFLSLDLNAVKQDIAKVLTTSQDWCRPTMATTARSSYAWPGTVPARIAPVTAAAVQAARSSDSSRSTAGPTMRISIRHGDCCGRSSRNTLRRFPGET